MISGFLNGNIGVVKSAIGEITDETNMAKAFGLTPIIWAAGLTIAYVTFFEALSAIQLTG